MRETMSVPTQAQRATELWVKQVGQALAKKFKVKVKKGKGWSADVTNGTLTYGDSIFELTHNQALGILCHEISHLLHTKHPAESEINKQFPELSHQAVNMLEDHRIEHLMGEKFLGAKEAIGMMHEATLKQHAKRLAESGQALHEDFMRADKLLRERGLKPLESPAELQKLRAEDYSTCGENNALRREAVMEVGSHDYVPMATQVLLTASLMHSGQYKTGFPNPEIESTASKIADKMKTAGIEHMQSTQEISDFFEKEIYPEMQSYFTEKEERQQASGRSAASVATEKSEEQKARSYGGNSKDEEMTEKIEDMVEASSGVRPDLKQKKQNGKWFKFDWKKTVGELQWEVGNSIVKLKRILKDNSFDRYGGRYLSGRLNQRKLWKHRRNDFRLFERKNLRDKKNYTFLINVDVSGSMQDYGRMYHAQRACVLLVELLQKTDFPVGIVTFGSSVNVVKHPSAQLDIVKAEKGLMDLEPATDLAGGVKQCVKLANQYDGVPIIITITDGQVYWRTQEEVRRVVQHNGHMHFYAIGLAKYDLGQMFKVNHFFRLTSSSQLVEQLLEILKKHIK